MECYYFIGICNEVVLGCSSEHIIIGCLFISVSVIRVSSIGTVVGLSIWDDSFRGAVVLVECF